ncbi:MAG: helix-turn-helix transcriptional regulator [Thiomonas sp.]
MQTLHHNDRDGLATVSQVTDFLQISRSTLWRLEQQGAICGVRIGRSLRFRWEDLRALAGSQQKGGAQ